MNIKKLSIFLKPGSVILFLSLASCGGSDDPKPDHFIGSASIKERQTESATAGLDDTQKDSSSSPELPPATPHLPSVSTTPPPGTPSEDSPLFPEKPAGPQFMCEFKEMYLMNEKGLKYDEKGDIFIEKSLRTPLPKIISDKDFWSRQLSNDISLRKKMRRDESTVVHTYKYSDGDEFREYCPPAEEDCLIEVIYSGDITGRQIFRFIGALTVQIYLADQPLTFAHCP